MRGPISRGQASIAGVIVGGGLTAELLLDAIPFDKIEILGTPAPLVALCCISGGPYDGLLIASKGGAVGSQDSIARLVDLILLWTEKA